MADHFRPPCPVCGAAAPAHHSGCRRELEQWEDAARFRELVAMSSDLAAWVKTFYEAQQQGGLRPALDLARGLSPYPELARAPRLGKGAR